MLVGSSQVALRGQMGTIIQAWITEKERKRLSGMFFDEGSPTVEVSSPNGSSRSSASESHFFPYFADLTCPQPMDRCSPLQVTR